MSELKFNQVSVKQPGGGFNLISAKEFISIPKEKQARLIMDKEITFLKDGEKIKPLIAVKSINQFLLQKA